MKKLPLPLKEAVRSSKKPPGKEVLEELLRRHFGHSHFRTKQLEAIQAALSGRDCFCLMPTGGGKSMCYQIPALAKVGIVLVISPLIALMENQVKTLKQKGISAEYLSSTQTPQVREKIHDELDCGKLSLRLLYVTPELVATPGFKAKLSKLHSRGLLSLIAIDEVHCISSWGHDFRPAYRKLSSLKNDLPDVPLLALTATAAPKVEKDVIESLGLRNPLILRASFNRPNIFYEVRYKDITDDTNTDLFNLIKSRGSVCSIIYCHERSTCDDLSAHLRKNGISCAAYHAGLNNKTRSNVLDDWISSRTQVVVATVAFGMGIDRKDVRLVCHYNIPKSMESFYQESGRAGRDNFSSESVLYYGLDDCRRMEFILRNAGAKRQKSSTVSDASVKKSLADFTQMVEYCEGSGCRRKKILECFGEQVSGSLCRKTCDACKDPCNVAASLRKLGHFSSNRQRVDSSMDFPSVAHETEFWNREEEEDLSEESISVSDDEAEVVNIRIKPTMQGDSRMELLQRAEERYYANSCPKRKAAGLSEKKAISGTLREAAKQRMSNALKQAHERLGIPIVRLLRQVFYNSQVASTVRWLSSSSHEQIDVRLGALSPLWPSPKSRMIFLPSPL
ncbi:unnamed protein product [Spirodela intermedia]|uniref:ATP-dependent DNA helicase n=1 Tax=Spirodela intermedia TaxID=51605 RepID=A0A7I8IMV5_SPIIN|nr:unnamed protein product [Spirodela intermedia]CAA6659306.1 unnamed protein product [Spirodela intermedia]